MRRNDKQDACPTIMKKRVLLFGGSFDPVHLGHYVAAQYVADYLKLDRVYFIPARQSPYKEHRAVASDLDRLYMVRRMTDEDTRFEESDVELEREGPSYSYDTVCYFQKKLRGADLYWLIGADCLEGLHRWHKAKELVEKCTIVTALRPGYEVEIGEEMQEFFGPRLIEKIREHIIETPLIDISSSEIRAEIAKGVCCFDMVGLGVWKYIVKERLYGWKGGFFK